MNSCSTLVISFSLLFLIPANSVKLVIILQKLLLAGKNGVIFLNNIESLYLQIQPLFSIIIRTKFCCKIPSLGRIHVNVFAIKKECGIAYKEMFL